MSGSHWGFILASYLVCIGVIGGMILAIVIDHRRLRAELTRLGGLRERTGEDDPA
jgi:heme exporter protein CcmD